MKDIVTCLLKGHKTKVIETGPEVRIYSDGSKSSNRMWIDHIKCTRCGKKWFGPTKDEIINKLNKIRK